MVVFRLQPKSSSSYMSIQLWVLVSLSDNLHGTGELLTRGESVSVYNFAATMSITQFTRWASHVADRSVRIDNEVAE